MIENNRGTALQTNSDKYLYSLDALRGLAALGVVFWHWQIFFIHGTEVARYDIQRQPLYSIFFPLYERGWMAVDLFFSLSGFVMFWLYSERIKQRVVGPWAFFVLRFSRLYPLHFLTLLAVLTGQIIFQYQNRSFFTYPANDTFHFILNLFFASAWGFESHYSFNGPAWSVSIEIALYAMFFAFCRLRRSGVAVALCFTGFVLIVLDASDVINSLTAQNFGRGLFSFFLGGIVYGIYRRRIPRRGLIGVTGICLALWVACVFEIKFGYFRNSVMAVLSSAAMNAVVLLFAAGVLFPLTIFILASWEISVSFPVKTSRLIGSISYSAYLLHFPLQLCIVIIVTHLGIGRWVFYSSTSLTCMFAVLIPLSLLAHRYFERPAQAILRTKLLPT
jgi:peptidoglycan/LPS O-acetylase OafA/YrhL